jgi:hypothetical protein
MDPDMADEVTAIPHQKPAIGVRRDDIAPRNLRPGVRRITFPVERFHEGPSRIAINGLDHKFHQSKWN